MTRAAFFKDLYSKCDTWYRAREKRERLLLISSLAVAAFILIYSGCEFVVGAFSNQSTRYAEVTQSLDRLAPLLNRYNVLKQRRAQVEARFASSNTTPATRAHLEGLIKRKAQVTAEPDIRKGQESKIEEKYNIVPFTVRFQQITPQELSDFLKELSEDKERPSLISRLTVRTRGSKLTVEVNLDFISKTQTA